MRIFARLNGQITDLYSNLFVMKIFKALFSGWFMGVLLLAFAFAVGYATFVENDHGAEASKLLVYNARWFELLLLLMVINFTGMIFTKKLYLKNKLNILAIHIALIIIVIGAGVTRYIGFEGQMHIRDGETANTFQSTTLYFQARYVEDGEQRLVSKPVLLSRVKSQLAELNFSINGNEVVANLNEYSPNTQEFLIAAEKGEPYVSIAIGAFDGNFRFYLKEGESRLLYDIGFSFGDTTIPDLVQIIRRDDGLFVRTPQLDSARLGQRKPFTRLDKGVVVQHNEVSFVVTEYFENGKIVFQHVDKEEGQGQPMATASVNGQHFFLPIGEEQSLLIGEDEVLIGIGYKTLTLPFSVRLNKFELERYPGSMSPSSFLSDVTVIDEVNQKEFDYDIFMNHVLQYEGYRFFQSSYDEDEQGTVLSINHDAWGTAISYAGYFLLFATLLISFFTKKTRFSRISQQLKEVHAKRKELATALLIIVFSSFGMQDAFAQNEAFETHAQSFGKVFVMNGQGRIEPINTLASQVVVKLSKKDSYNGMNANEVFLSMVSDRDRWKTEPIIKVPEESIQKQLGISSSNAAYNDFVDETGAYKLSKAVEEAYQKKPSMRSQHDKGIINVDERLNVFFMVMNRSMLKIFPTINGTVYSWATPIELHKQFGHGTENGDLFENYTNDLTEAYSSGNYEKANASLQKIKEYQTKNAGDVLPSATKLKMEVFYNETNIFKRLFPFYMLIGSVFVALFFIQTFKPSFEFNRLRMVLVVLLSIAFSLQTVGLAVRWYISGHAPWSNGYESMIYISWATLLAGFMFMRRSVITIGVTALLAGITLLTAHMSWLNPELTNLVPVLKSHWLTIHVATITASYGFLGLGCMVAFLNLCLMMFRTQKNLIRINLALKELMLIIELSITVGLILLVIGNFLGGIWANESWGRYWGWDPKESWTLVTIILYSFTLHLTLIPAIRNTFTFSFMSFLSFGAVLMTYFGVNYYLTGLHSYAAGEAPAVPTALYYVAGAIAIISLLAARNEWSFGKLEKKQKK
jgi:cytochrome c-type biogenesis protein CcsB